MPYFIPQRKNPLDNYHGVSRLHDDIDRLFNCAMFPRAWTRERWPEAESVAPTPDFLPQLDVTSSESAYTMRLELPGVAPEDVNIKVADNVLTVSGEKRLDAVDGAQTHVQERTFGTFSRSLTLPEDADMENIHAFARNGVLSVEIPRRKPEAAKTRTIEVQRG